MDKSNKLECVPGKPLQPSLMLVGKPGGYLSEAAIIVANVIKLLTAIIYEFRNKLECLSLATFSA